MELVRIFHDFPTVIDDFSKKPGMTASRLFGPKLAKGLNADDVAVYRGRRGRKEYDHACAVAVDTDECAAAHAIQLAME